MVITTIPYALISFSDTECFKTSTDCIVPSSANTTFFIVVGYFVGSNETYTSGYALLGAGPAFTTFSETSYGVAVLLIPVTRGFIAFASTSVIAD